jgi:hypothetical protein
MGNRHSPVMVLAATIAFVACNFASHLCRDGAGVLNPRGFAACIVCSPKSLLSRSDANRRPRGTSGRRFLGRLKAHGGTICGRRPRRPVRGLRRLCSLIDHSTV